MRVVLDSSSKKRDSHFMTKPDILRSSTEIADHKVISYQEAQEILAMCREESVFAVLAMGVFDGLHPGHMNYLLSARDAGQRLFVGIENDETVRQNKGLERPRPHFSVDSRLKLLSALEPVTYVFAFTDDVIYDGTASREVYVRRYRDLSPSAIAVTAWDPHLDQKRAQAYEAGIDLIVVSGENVHSSTRMFESHGWE